MFGWVRAYQALHRFDQIAVLKSLLSRSMHCVLGDKYTVDCFSEFFSRLLWDRIKSTSVRVIIKLQFDWSILPLLLLTHSVTVRRSRYRRAHGTKKIFNTITSQVAWPFSFSRSGRPYIIKLQDLLSFSLTFSITCLIDCLVEVKILLWTSLLFFFTTYDQVSSPKFSSELTLAFTFSIWSS